MPIGRCVPPALLSAMLLNVLDVAIVPSRKLRSGSAVGAKEFIELGVQCLCVAVTRSVEGTEVLAVPRNLASKTDE